MCSLVTSVSLYVCEPWALRAKEILLGGKEKYFSYVNIDTATVGSKQMEIFEHYLHFLANSRHH